MKKFCVVAISIRCGSTYLVSFINRYIKNCINLEEFFNMSEIYLPRNLNEGKIRINNLETQRLISEEKYKELSILLKKSWTSKLHTNNYKLDKEFKIIKEIELNPINRSIKKTFKKHFNIVLDSKQSLVFKIFSMDIGRFKKFYSDFLIKIKNEVNIIFLERENILDMCVSSVYANHFDVYNILEEYHNVEINENIICKKGSIDWVFENIKYFSVLKKQLKEDEYTTIYFDEMFDDIKLLKKLKLDDKIKNQVILPTKLYPNYNTQQKLSYIVNIKEFWKYYNEGLEYLREE